MRISLMNNSVNNNRKISFAGDKDNNIAAEAKQIAIDIKKAIKSNANLMEIEKLEKRLKETEKKANEQIKKDLNGQNIKIPAIFTKVVKWFGKIEKTGNKNLDTAAMLTRVVLWGNVGKEVVGTGLYTVQALTNQDLPEDKRKFVGMYDLGVGIVSTTFSFIFGVGLENKIKQGYKKLLAPMSKSDIPAMRSKASAAIVGLAAFSSFFLQTIIGKRIVAPAVATPVAGKLKSKMEEREAAKKGNKKVEEKMSPMSPEVLVMSKIPTEPQVSSFKQKLNTNN